MQEHQLFLSNATLSKVSDLASIMEINGNFLKYFEVYERNWELGIKNNISEN